MKKTKLTRIFSSIAAFVLAFAFFALTACGETEIKKAVLESIAVTKQPTTTEYTVGESFKKDGMVVTATYDDKSSKAVTNYTVNPSGALKLEDKKVQISYTEEGVTKTADVAITVKAAALPQNGKLTGISAKAKEGKEVELEYELGATFDASNIEVTAEYDNGATAVLSADKYTVSPKKIEDVNETVITITYTEGGKTVKTYFEPHLKLRILAPEVNDAVNSIAKTIPFDPNVGSDPDVTLKGTSRTTWQTEPNQFGRLRTSNKDAEILFHHDYSGLEDVSKAAFRTMMGVGRGRTVISVGHSKEGPWTVIAKAEDYQNTIPADYKYPCGIVDGKDATDGVNKNVYFCYYMLGEYLKENKDIYVKFSCAEAAPANWLGADKGDGSDLMNNFVFYNVLDIEKSTNVTKVPTNLRILRGKNEGEEKSEFKTEYTYGEVFDPKGILVQVTWSDESKTIVRDVKAEGFTWEPSGPLCLGQDSVQFTYMGKHCKVSAANDNFVVKPKTAAALKAITVKSAPAKTEYEAGEVFDASGLVLEAEFTDGEKEDVVGGWTIAGLGAGDTLAAGTEKLTLSYTANEATQSAELQIRVFVRTLTDEDKVVDGQVLFDKDENYTKSGNITHDAAQARYMIDLKDESGALVKAERVRVQGAPGDYIQIEYTFKGEDLSMAGFMVYLLHERGGTVVEVSATGEEDSWTTIAKAAAGDKNIPADFKELGKITKNADGSEDADMQSGKMEAMYYSLGKYLTASKKIYIRFKYEKPVDGYAGNDSAGPDLFYGVTFYSKLDLSKVSG